jgi:membrane protein DedA with SNARE-associated domain
VNQITDFIQQLSVSAQMGGEITNFWIYPVLMLMVLVEGPFAILVASSAASTGFLLPIPVFLAASLGNLIADVLWYFLGRSGKLEWILKIRWVKLTPEKLAILTRSVEKNAVKILFIAKVTNGLIVPALIATGLARVKLRRWFPMIFISNLLITAVFVLLGYFTALNIMKLQHWVRYLALGFSILLIFFFSWYAQHLLSRQTSIETLLVSADEEAGRE